MQGAFLCIIGCLLRSFPELFSQDQQHPQLPPHPSCDDQKMSLGISKPPRSNPQLTNQLLKQKYFIYTIRKDGSLELKYQGHSWHSIREENTSLKGHINVELTLAIDGYDAESQGSLYRMEDAFLDILALHLKICGFVPYVFSITKEITEG